MLIRGQRVILDSDLAAFYGETTKRLNQQVNRNRVRFPEDFMFQLDAQEFANLRLQFATSSLKGDHGGRRYAPMAFTEHGAIMASMVLGSPRATALSVHVVRASEVASAARQARFQQSHQRKQRLINRRSHPQLGPALGDKSVQVVNLCWLAAHD